MGADQKQSGASTVSMDARKFLRAINEGAESRLNLYKTLVARMGREQDSDWRLVSLRKDYLIFEDVDHNTYHLASVKTQGRKIKIDGIKDINIVDSTKPELFKQHCNELVNTLSEDDLSGAENSFKKIEFSRFRPQVIPSNGYIRTRDDNVHRVQVFKESNEKDYSGLTTAVAQAFVGGIQISEGKVVGGEFGGGIISSPITEFTKRMAVAKNMKAIAEDAYQKTPFQDSVYAIAGLICERKIAEAVNFASKLLEEYQEFCVLTREEISTLVENALAGRGVMNPTLCEETSTLFYKTNLKTNKKSIMESWQRSAEKAQYAPLTESVRDFIEAESFESAYDGFLKKIFTEGANFDKDDLKRTYVSDYLRKVINLLPEEEEKYRNDLQELLDNLESPQGADDATYNAIETVMLEIGQKAVDLAEGLGVENIKEFDRVGEPYVDDDEPLLKDTDIQPVEEPGEDLGAEGDLGLDDLGDEGMGAEGGEEDLDFGAAGGGGGLGGGEEFDLDFEDEDLDIEGEPDEDKDEVTIDTGEETITIDDNEAGEDDEDEEIKKALGESINISATEGDASIEIEVVDSEMKADYSMDTPDVTVDTDYSGYESDEEDIEDVEVPEEPEEVETDEMPSLDDEGDEEDEEVDDEEVDEEIEAVPETDIEAEENEPDDEVEEDQYKSASMKKMGYEKSSINASEDADKGDTVKEDVDGFESAIAEVIGSETKTTLSEETKK